MSQRIYRTQHVEASACRHCGADVAIALAEARKCVSGTRHCVQPALKPSIDPPRSKTIRRERNKVPTFYIPGLPDDLAIACLIRVPRIFHSLLRLVCKKWCRLLSNNYFYSLRYKLGMAEEWIYVVKRDRENKIGWHAFDPTYQLWQPLPPIPSEFCEALGFGCAVLSGCLLFLFGGKDPITGSMKRVVFYSARTNKWHKAADMMRRRHFFASCVMNNCLYVAGGECEGSTHLLRSAEVYDPNKNRWGFISDLNAPMLPLVGVVHGAKWYLKGLSSHRQVTSEVYMPATDHWSVAGNGPVSAWHNPIISLHGQLYAVDCPDGCRLRVYDETNESWSRSVDSKVHLGNSKDVEAAALLSLGGKLCIIRNNMSISVADVSNVECSAKKEQLWETISGRGQLKSFVSDLWSKFYRNGKKSQIVHCQILQA
ncbi:hypothetical protein KP509_19G019100 [Ceratopteris richardii]|uniref:F-box domain-containing protein n=1 Tax=Ceratopteris richardii TaxID=49495 RepID=A0A8T2SIJ3_CERRI|nr:hypothetical protein KP509_19G019100 [Ceratopteris richardii]KAH7351890.1 hypothetical protein KP509_19G019100 [Ceratopteris richardii]KAH7351891.1 hypothetical protein KP509_19G019100 [Ceratopteris richardii]